jgi:hypothetical protein
MNHILRLQTENKELKNQLDSVSQELQAFKAYLQTSPKFNGTEQGERKDWIATTDVINRLQEINNLAFINK